MEKWGLLDATGKEITEFKFDLISYFNEGLAKVSIEGKSGFINNKGEEVIPIKYENADFDMSVVRGSNTGFFKEGLAKVKINGKWGFINQNGEIVIPIIYDKVDAFREGMTRVTKDGKQGYINTQGVEVITIGKYDAIEQFSFSSITVAYLNKKCGLIDKTGKEITPMKYDFIFGFCEGLAKVKIGELLGFINEAGTEVIPIIYQDVHYCFDDGITAAKLDEKWGFINKSNEVIIPFTYDQVVFDNGSGLFYEQKVKVVLNNREFYINRYGNEVKN